MAKLYEELDANLQSFIEAQKMFFVATAASSADGFINCSPKGLDTLRILDPKTVAYLDFTGSGIETVAHLKDNGRFVLMFCSFSERPLILRLHGTGTVVEKDDPEFEELLPLFPDMPGVRAVIKMDVTRIADSCGWGVPMYDFKGERDTYFKFVQQIGDQGLRDAQSESNLHSLDGLPGLKQPV